jgi:hypothetical protein
MSSNFATRMQRAQLHGNRSCLFVFISIPRVRVCMVSTDKVFHCAIAL